MKTFFVSYIGLLLMFSCQATKKDTPCIDETKINDGMCTMQYDPVCGCDGKTYGNPCMTGKAGVTSYVKGKCDEEAVIY